MGLERIMNNEAAAGVPLRELNYLEKEAARKLQKVLFARDANTALELIKKSTPEQLLFKDEKGNSALSIAANRIDKEDMKNVIMALFEKIPLETIKKEHKYDPFIMKLAEQLEPPRKNDMLKNTTPVEKPVVVGFNSYYLGNKT